MKTLCVLQHVEAEYLGLLEDHFEARNIRFRYCRPFTPGASIPTSAEEYDGLILLGAGPKGIVSGDLIPSLGAELRLTRDFLDRGLPVIGIGIGACILTTAAGGGAEEAPLRFTLDNARRVVPDALGGMCRQRFRLGSICATVRSCLATPGCWRSAPATNRCFFKYGIIASALSAIPGSSRL